MAKGENIFKRKDGRWEARYIKGYDKNRKIQYGFCYGHSYREAKEKVNHAKLQISHENFPGKSNRKESEKLLTESICISWLEVNRNKLKYSSYSKYKVILEKHLLPEFGLYLISEITSEHIADFTNRLLNQECLAIKTVRDILLLLHAILVYGCEKSNGTFTPVRIVYPKEERKELRVLSQMEQLRLMQYLEKDMDLYKLGVMLAITTGLRVGEICGLRWENISFENHTLSVKNTVQRVRNSSMEPQNRKTMVVIGTPKSHSSMRTIPLTDGVFRFCEKFQCADKSVFILTGNHSFIEPRLLQRKLNEYYRQCEIADAHFHTLRHTFATRCIEVGFDVKTLSEILGHSSTVITMNRYVHPDLNLKRKNIQKLETAGFGCTAR